MFGSGGLIENLPECLFSLTKRGTASFSDCFSPVPPAGQLEKSDIDGDGNPKLWCALSHGRVVVFDAASWSMQQNGIQVGALPLVRHSQSQQTQQVTTHMVINNSDPYKEEVAPLTNSLFRLLCTTAF